jgi:hypothetical protein
MTDYRGGLTDSTEKIVETQEWIPASDRHIPITSWSAWPAVDPEIDVSRGERNLFLCKQTPLGFAGAAFEGNSPARINNPVPGDIHPRGKSVEGVADQPGVMRHSG